MKLAEVFTRAAERIQAGHNHFCCTAIAQVLMDRPITSDDELYAIKAVQRFLTLATPDRFIPEKPDYAALSNDMMGRFKDVAAKLVVASGDGKDAVQAHQIESRMRCELLVKLSKLEQAEKEDA